MKASDITNAIVSSLDELGLSLNDIQGQGYNGVSTMSGERTDVKR